MISKKTIVISAVMASSILSGASPHTVSYAEDNSQIAQRIKEVGINPEHPEIQSEIDRYGVKQLELEAVKRESKKKETELNNHKQEKTLAEEKLKTLTDEEDKLKKETEALENKLKEIEETKAQEEVSNNFVTTGASNSTTSNSGSYGYGGGSLAFGADGLLVEQHTAASQNVINLLLGIPNHSNGAWYHQSTGLDSYIDQLSIEEAVNVIHRIEGAGFGQTGAGYAGFDTPESHRVFVEQQVNGRFGGDIRLLLKKWGTYSYGGY